MALSEVLTEICAARKPCDSNYHFCGCNKIAVLRFLPKVLTFRPAGADYAKLVVEETQDIRGSDTIRVSGVILVDPIAVYAGDNNRHQC